MTKSFWASWTVWFGIAQITLGVLGFLSGKMGGAEASTLISTGAGTIGFRLKTTTPIQ